jgi:MoaA/NifB/PqqE/SkfB family radical SAM enzyme
MSDLFAKKMRVAVAAHTAGDLQSAHSQYTALFADYADRVDLMHNLGLVKLLLGEINAGAQLMQKAIMADPDNAGMRNSAKLLGTQLYQNHYWEDALTWIKRAIQIDPNDRELHSIAQRISARAHLMPEVYDPLEHRTLKRFSPREGSEYIYTIDVAGTCNLRCPSCPVGNSSDTQRVKSMMPVAMFKQIITKMQSESPSPSAQVRLYNWGEPLLHPQLVQLIEVCHSAGFSSHLSSNLNIKPKYLEQALAANPTEFKVSLSGFTQARYAHTHTGGDIEVVKQNLRLMREWLDHYRANTRVWVNFHRYKSNLDDEPSMAALCQELDFMFAPINAFYQPLDKLLALAQGETQVLQEPVVSQLLYDVPGHLEYLQQNAQPDYDCELRFNQMVINSDGSVAQCCALYGSSTMLQKQFLEHSHAQLEEAKYANPICTQCRQAGLDFSPISALRVNAHSPVK